MKQITVEPAIGKAHLMNATQWQRFKTLGADCFALYENGLLISLHKTEDEAKAAAKQLESVK
jgi:hypothetical protein